jgi:uncharacterized heparinase superfamily protein
LEDMLDLYNVARAYSEHIQEHWTAFVMEWPSIINRMRRWLGTMSHPDGEISFFNDSAMGVAASPIRVENYAERLGFGPVPAKADGLTHLKESGYIRLQKGTAVAFFDVAPIGPDYLPAHAHADTLSFELSLFGRRVIVNSGTSCYGESPERMWQRGTAAHNTVSVDAQDSSEVWAGFRVGRRAKVRLANLNIANQSTEIEAEHNGYSRLPGKNIHRRKWLIREGCFGIQDELSGKFGSAEARFYLHPSIKAVKRHADDSTVLLSSAGMREILFSTHGGTISCTPSIWHPCFGVSEPNTCLIVQMNAPTLKTTITWNEAN